MANKNYLEIQNLTDVDLVAEANEVEEQYAKIKFDHAAQGLDNPLEIRKIRRDVARLKTELRKRELDKMSAEELANRSKIRERRRLNRRMK